MFNLVFLTLIIVNALTFLSIVFLAKKCTGIMRCMIDVHERERAEWKGQYIAQEELLRQVIEEKIQEPKNIITNEPI